MKYNKIVFEGPNNVGKSTLIKSLQDFIDFESEHVTEVCPNNYTFCDDLLSNNESMFLDRLHLSELVYSEVFSRDCNLTNEEFVKLVNEHKDHTLIVIVDADYDFMIRAAKTKLEYFDYEISKQERNLFYEIWQKLRTMDGVNVIRVKNHWDDETKSILTGQLLEACRR